MSSARRVYSSLAFILLHGVVPPEFLIDRPNPSENPPVYQYRLSATDLPKNITLYAPSILGYSYYDQTKTVKFITTLNGQYKRSKQLMSYTDFCLREIHELEQRHVERLMEKLEDDRAYGREVLDLDMPKSPFDRKKRLYRLEVTTLKPRVVWKQHDCYIREKTYDIYPTSVTETETETETDTDNELPNCIMIFCETDKPDADVQRVINTTFNNPKTRYVSSTGKSIVYTVDYDSVNSIFKINFGNTEYLENITFEDITSIISLLLTSVTPATSFDEIALDLFDFTCSEIEFPVHQRPEKLTSVLLSSDNTDASDPKLVYGTISEDRFSQMEDEVRYLQAQYNASVSPSSSVGLTSPSSSVAPTYSPSDKPTTSSSPARPPTASLVVHLSPKVASFADFQPIISSQSVEPSRSPSSSASNSFSSFEYGSSASGPPLFRLNSLPSVSSHTSGRSYVSVEIPGGSRRRRRRIRVGKKVTNKRITRGRSTGRFRAKGSSRRTQRKQK